MPKTKYAPATERNRQPILEVLQKVLPDSGTVLEIASGTGEHAVFFAPRLPHLQWLPSEPQEVMRESIHAWRQALPARNLLAPVALDVSTRPWPTERPAEQTDEYEPPELTITAIVNINMVHICAWEMCERLMAGAERVLSAGGILYLYGPFKQGGRHTAPSNESFDAMLRDRNSDWGVRDLEAVIAIAQQHHLQHVETIPMPANNLSVVFRRD
ncbi:MAG: DUF938 domain-containing protein [Cyanobacteria bacterium J06623_5]